MVEMNPYYAHPSTVGNVFDVATWSPRKALTMAFVGVIAAVLFGAAALYAYSPRFATSLVFEKADVPDPLREANAEFIRIQKKHPWPVRAGVGVLALLSFGCASGAVNSLLDFHSGNFYFRAGPGGMSIRVPGDAAWKRLGMHPGAFQVDIPWSDIREWKIVQKKQFGSLSANAGNLDADITIKTSDGGRHSFSLDIFREPARIIYNRINDATEMTVAQFDSGTERLDEEELVEAGYGE